MKKDILNNINKVTDKESHSSSLSVLLFIVQLIGLLLLQINNIESADNPSYLMLALPAIFIVFSMLSTSLIPKLLKVDNTLSIIVNMIFTIGLLTIIRLSPTTGSQHIIWYLLSQFISLLVFVIIAKWPRFFMNKFFFYFVVTLATFIATLLLGYSSGGAKNWIRISDSITIQLSEFAKISYVFMLASFYYQYEDLSKLPFGKYYLNIATYIFIGMFFLQGELGTAMVFFAVFILSMFVFERSYLRLFLNILLAFAGLFLAYKLFGHIKVRFDIWRDPWSDYHGKGYQPIQGLFAIASGGLFGSGLGLGSPNLVPVATSDFIMPAVIEEMGIFMGIALVLLFLILIYKGVKISMTKKDIFTSSLAFGITIIFASQALVMFAGVLKIIPLTGITTPFMSYGGSSTLTSFILLYVLQYASKEGVETYEQQ